MKRTYTVEVPGCDYVSTGKYRPDRRAVAMVRDGHVGASVRVYQRAYGSDAMFTRLPLLDKVFERWSDAVAYCDEAIGA